jgi:TM2 domain-containing membrane protein YozV
MSPGHTDASPNPPQGPENRRLKIAGVVLLCVSLPALGFLGDTIKARLLLHAGNWRLALLALLFFVAGNVFALGLIVLLAGFRNLDLTAPQARRGVLVKMVGANLLLFCTAWVSISESDLFRELKGSWVVLPILALFLFVAWSAIVLLRRGWKYDALPADKVIQQDKRPPVVYIRSFKDDGKLLPGGWRARWFSVVNWTTAVSVEQELAIIMERVGPVVAIGKPGELLPELGAARLYASDDEWQATITDLMRRAGLVVVLAGATANLKWEIDQAVNLLPRRQLIFVSLGKGRGEEAFDKDVERRFGRPEADEPPRRKILLWLLALFWLRRAELGKIIYFGKDSKPCVEPIRFRMSWTGVVILAYRPYWDALVVSFRRVFSQLGLPWAERKTRATAIMLAVFGGGFGLHHFYLGNRRKGWFSLAFFWTTVPFILGFWYAIQLMLTSQQDFARRFIRHSAAEEDESWSSDERSRILE